MTIKYLDAKRIRGVLKTGKVGAKNWKSTTGNSGIQLGTTALATGDFTVGMWVKRNTTQTACIYATDDAGGASGKITLKWHDDTNYGMWATYDGTTHIKIGSLGGETGVWRHVALTGIDNSGTITLTLYINGAVATPSGSGGTSNPTTDSTTTRSDNTAKTIGNENTAGDGLIGELDEFFIYNRGLSTSEVLSIANGTKKPDDSSLNTSSSLKCYLPLDADYNDASGLGNNGTESSVGSLDGNGALVAETEVDEKVSLGTAIYASGTGTGGDFDTASNVSVNSSVSTPSGLGDDTIVANNTKLAWSASGTTVIPHHADFTMAYWLYPTDVSAGSPSTNQSWIQPSSGSAPIRAEQMWSGGANKVSFIVTDDDGDNAGGNYTFTSAEDTWHLFIGDFDASTGKSTYYCGKVGTDSTPQELGNNTDSGCKGASSSTELRTIAGNDSEYFKGRWGEFCIWNKVLSSSERSSLYNSGNGAKANTVAKANITAYFDGSSATGVNLASDAVEYDLPENTLFEETDVKTFANSQSNAGIETYWLQDNEWKKGYDTLVLDHSSSTGNQNSLDDRTALGEKILSGNSLIGKKVKSIKVKLKVGAGSPAGDIVMNVVNNASGGSYGTVKHTFGTALGASAVLTSSYVEYEFVASSPYTVVANDCFNVQLTSGTETDNHSGSIYILMDCKDTSQSNADLVRFQDSGGWSTETAKSCYMKFYGSAT